MAEKIRSPGPGKGEIRRSRSSCIQGLASVALEGADEVRGILHRRGFLVTVRVAAAVGGGYAAAAGLAALLAVALPAAGLMARSEAVVLTSMLAFLAYLALLIFAFACRDLGRLCLLVLGGAVASWAGAWTLARLTVGG